MNFDRALGLYRFGEIAVRIGQTLVDQAIKSYNSLPREIIPESGSLRSNYPGIYEKITQGSYTLSEACNLAERVTSIENWETMGGVVEQLGEGVRLASYALFFCAACRFVYQKFNNE